MKVGCVKKILRFLEPGVRGRRAWDMKTECEAEQRFLSGSEIKAQKSVRVELEIFSHRFAGHQRARLEIDNKGNADSRSAAVPIVGRRSYAP